MESRSIKLRQGLETLGVTLEERALLRQLSFLDELIRWGKRINLTAILDPDAGLEKHLIDSLVLLPHLGKGPLLDVGSGAGLPGIPLAIARPNLQVFSVEAVTKKISFQKHVRRHFALQNFTPENCRIEALTPRQPFPIITARAFASIAMILELVAELLAADGKILLLRGKTDESLHEQTIQALKKFQLQITHKQTYQLPFSGAQRQLLHICHL